jgi:hypothetical protein
MRNSINIYPLKSKDLEESYYISEINPDKIFIEKEYWPSTDDSFIPNKKVYSLYWGPVETDDERYISDMVSLKEKWYKKILKILNIEDYDINASENCHNLYFTTDDEADLKFEEIINILKINNFTIVRDH